MALFKTCFLAASLLYALGGSASATPPTIAPPQGSPLASSLDLDGTVHDTLVSHGVKGDQSAMLFAVQSPMKPWNLTRIDADTIDFELRQGDQFSYDIGAKTGSERVELAARRYTAGGTDFDTVPNGTRVHVRRTLTVKPGPPNSTAWLVMGQFHQEDEPGQRPWSPPFEWSFVAGTDQMRAMVRFGDGTPGTANSYTEVPIWTDTMPVVRGQARVYDVYMVVDPTGVAGRVTVLRDGMILASYKGKIGYTLHKAVYWKDGIYRHGPTPETMRTRVADPFFETGAGVIFPDDVVATHMSRPSTVASGPVLTLGKVEGPFGDGTYRTHVSLSATPNTPVSLTLDGRTIAAKENAAQATDATGALTAGFAVPGSDAVQTIVVIIGDQTVSMKLKAGDGTVSVAH